uniref:Reverse transcriptase zinc-binding domain-containing protein n=1 Tax=Strongyloides stercoralis TaxID=6248 RepID=A0AAF5I2T0_STRER
MAEKYKNNKEKDGNEKINEDETEVSKFAKALNQIGDTIAFSELAIFLVLLNLSNKPLEGVYRDVVRSALSVVLSVSENLFGNLSVNLLSNSNMDPTSLNSVDQGSSQTVVQNPGQEDNQSVVRNFVNPVNSGNSGQVRYQSNKHKKKVNDNQIPGNLNVKFLLRILYE